MADAQGHLQKHTPASSRRERLGCSFPSGRPSGAFCLPEGKLHPVEQIECIARFAFEVQFAATNCIPIISQ
jgi:hypothetical protein